jgi:DNA primase
VTWDELIPALDPVDFNVNTVPARLARIGGDPWREMGKVRQGLPTKSGT